MEADTPPGLLDCALSQWSPQIGDPGLTGWLTVSIYVLAAVIAAVTAWRAPFPRRSRARERFFWWALALAMLLLAVNKQLDLQSFLTATGRCVAVAEGWYDERRDVQRLFILGLGYAAVVSGLLMLWLLWGTLRRSFFALLGMVFVLGFVMIRAVGFHNFDRLINSTLEVEFLSIPLNVLFEISGPLLIALTGLILQRQRKRYRY